MAKKNILLSIFFLTFVVHAVMVNEIYAHQPHDVIDAFEISPSFNMDNTLFVVMNDYVLMKSSDGGYTWQWLTGGLDNKRALSSIAVSPDFDTDGTLFISSKGDGIYKSQDKGFSWFKVNAGLIDLSMDLVSCSSDYAFDQIVLAAATQGGMYKTINGGQEWYSVIDESIKITAIAFSPDIRNDGQIFAGDDSGSLYYSIDKGQSWMKQSIKVSADPISSIILSPAFPNDNTMFLGTFGDGIFKSIDNGISFFEVNAGITDKSITSIAISPEFTDDATIYAAGADQAVFKSDDGGSSWGKYKKGIYYRNQGSIHYKFLRISNAFKADGSIFLGSFEGLFKSENRGQSWFELETYQAKTVTGIALSPEFMIDRTIFISTYGGGVYQSDDNGITWNIYNVGLERPWLYDVILSPRYLSDDTIFTLELGYVAKSVNGGQRWNLNQISDKKEVFPTVICASPDYMVDNTLYFGSRRHGAFKSTDGGKSWINLLSSTGRVTSVAISPAHASDNTLYIGTFSQGILKTMDRGDTWQFVNNGLTSLQKIKLVCSPDYENDNTVFAGTESGLFKTVDGGSNWELTSNLQTIQDGLVVNLAISPDYSNDKTVLISVLGMGLFETNDGGVSWHETGLDLEGSILTEIVFSPTYSTDNTLLGASFAKLFKSTDKGSNWEILKRPVRYENTSDFVKYLGSWRVLKNDNASAQTLSYTMNRRRKCVFNFVGTGISWIGTRSPFQGIASVYVDGVFMDKIDQYSETTKFIETLFSVSDLPYGHHWILVDPKFRKNRKSSGRFTVIDAFDVGE